MSYMSSYLFKTFNCICMSTCAYTLKHTGVQTTVEARGTGFPGAGVTGGRESDMGGKNQSYILCKNSTCSYPLTHLASPALFFTFYLRVLLSSPDLNSLYSLDKSWTCDPHDLACRVFEIIQLRTVKTFFPLFLRQDLTNVAKYDPEHQDPPAFTSQILELQACIFSSGEWTRGPCVC